MGAFEKIIIVDKLRKENYMDQNKFKELEKNILWDEIFKYKAL